MNKKKIIYPAITAIALAGAISPSAAQKNKQPNIIYILADDMGYGDVGCYGQKYIKTPNIDRLAAEGIRFTQHYTSAPVCAPARCCLMTGKHSGHAFVRNNHELKDSSDFKTGQLPIPDKTETIAEMLKKHGYTTAIIGKWGLGSIASEGAPNKQGFDFFYGYADQVHAHNHYPTFLWRNDKQEFLPGNIESVHPKVDRDKETGIDEYKKYMGPHYSLDLMTDEAVRFIGENKKNPFFLYLAYVVPHKALQVPDESLKMYEGVFDEQPYDGKRGYTPHPKPLSAYAAMITRMDQKIGTILDELKKQGLDENTIVMFTSDNGPAGGGGLDIRFFNSSGGLRGMKGQVYEGGIREPFVARWPGKIAPGTVTGHISAHYDLMATLAELNGQKLNDTDGISFLPTLLGNSEKQQRHEYLYWEFSSGGGQYAVRIGNWKGVYSGGFGRNSPKSWKVYDLSTDESESNDLAAQHPELVEKFEQIAKQRIPSHIKEWNF
ncbi:MAG: arylsulfatase [Prolixibacteraceae bacterium]|jgi:arylsulfatase A-like enzyme|nr:arylsulfatase [Prolixibacteraceae bacterium]